MCADDFGLENESDADDDDNDLMLILLETEQIKMELVKRTERQQINSECRCIVANANIFRSLIKNLGFFIGWEMKFRSSKRERPQNETMSVLIFVAFLIDSLQYFLFLLN